MIRRLFDIRYSIFLLLACAPLWAEGLSTSFVDVQVNGVPRGVPYEVHSSMGPGLYLTNLGDVSINVKVEALKPAPGELQKGSSTIPDLQWIRIEPDHFVLAPHARGSCRVILTVPDKWVYKNKTYQVKIWSRSETVEIRGVRVGAGLISRLRFKIK